MVMGSPWHQGDRGAGDRHERADADDSRADLAAIVHSRECPGTPQIRSDAELRLPAPTAVLPTVDRFDLPSSTRAEDVCVTAPQA
ncbi:hypothetical protein GCM10022261_10540 [Brevibacterium daeguense]|uniref:Uncharacterized protein n=1 Tax=Brevibacterium daeguense TaxID=909936 RepID=A0ABP8EHX6_9MICO